MFQSILVPVDGSESSSRAVALAIQIARLTNARMLFAHIVDRATEVERAEAPFVDPEKAIEPLKRDGESLLSEALASARASGIAAESEQIEGGIVDAIVELADERRCDLIVMGSHGRTGLARLFLGSVTDGVLRNSRVPVLCVRAETQLADEPPEAEARE